MKSKVRFILLLAHPHSDAHRGFLYAVVAVFAIVLAPIFWMMWIYQGTGNANFYYAINLVLTVAQIWFINDCIADVLKTDYLQKKAAKEAKIK